MQATCEDLQARLWAAQEAAKEAKAREADAAAARDRAEERLKQADAELRASRASADEAARALVRLQEEAAALRAQAQGSEALRSTVEALRAQLAMAGDTRVEAAGLRAQLWQSDAKREAAEAEAAALRDELAALGGVHAELREAAQRLRRDAAAQALSADRMASELAERQTAAALSMDHGDLRGQLQVARTNLVICSEKLESESWAWGSPHT